jgi:teichuronic acid biosynthesis glycosyltransferase TuaC
MVEKNLLIVSPMFPDYDNTYVGGIFVKEQIKYIRKYFDNVYVISPIPYTSKRSRDNTIFDYCFDNVHVFFPKYYNIPSFVKHLRFLGVIIEAEVIKSLIKREQISFDLIHAHFTWPSGAVAIRIKESVGCPVVITEHTSRTLNRAIDEKDPIFLKAWEHCDALIRVNEKDIPKICACGIEPSKVHHVPNGYDPKTFRPIDTKEARRSLGLPIDKKLILNVGGLDEVKGQRYLISAVNELVDEADDVICYIIGAGPLRRELEQQISSLGLEEHVKLTGFIPNEQMYLWMNACDIFVLPSLNESFGIVQIEAMGCGKPIIATRNGGSEDIITSDDYGLLVEPADYNDLADKIQMALDTEWDREEILRYAEQYAWENIAKKIINIYERVLE